MLECVQGVRMGKRKGNFGRAMYNSSFWGCRGLEMLSTACGQAQRTQEVTNNLLPESSLYQSLMNGSLAEFTFRYCS